MLTIDLKTARRLALVRAGLLKPEWTGQPRRATGRGKRVRSAALSVIRRFGYLQLDTVSVAGARSHGIVLASRFDGFAPDVAESLLQPGEPLFEYWGHEACWMPLALYPAFEFRRRAFRVHPWCANLVDAHPREADALRRRVRDEGPLRSLDLEGEGGGGGWWDHKVSKRLANALWSSGELAIRERRNFQRTYDLAERVIPSDLRDNPLDMPAALRQLLWQALAGHGWATTGTLAATWRLRNCRADIDAALRAMTDAGEIAACTLVTDDGRRIPGWMRCCDLELAGRVGSLRPRGDRGVLLSPFDPVLWDRTRVRLLFGFDQVLEIFKPAASRRYGYYCMPVLAGESLVARFDLKAHAAQRQLEIRAVHIEPCKRQSDAARQRLAAQHALSRYAAALEFDVSGEAAGQAGSF